MIAYTDVLSENEMGVVEKFNEQSSEGYSLLKLWGGVDRAVHLFIG